ALGVVVFQAFIFFLPAFYRPLLEDHDTIASVIPLLLTGPLLILNLYFNPGGLAQQAFEARDNFLRKIAKKRGIHVPSLVADRLLEDAQERGVIQHAEEAVEHAEEADADMAYTCPACDALLSFDELAVHEHLQVRTPEVVG
ncbi:MAG: hypothetical protein ABIO67_11895, partial [Mycobacteriales bacterium]